MQLLLVNIPCQKGFYLKRTIDQWFLLVLNSMTVHTQWVLRKFKISDSWWKAVNNLSGIYVCLIVLNIIFNNISAISWRSVLLVEETGGPGESHWPVASHWQTLSHNVVHLSLIEIQTNNISGDGYWWHR
jgi:hypothetical protein